MKHLALFLLWPALLSGAETWPQWRGPDANGHAGKGDTPRYGTKPRTPHGSRLYRDAVIPRLFTTRVLSG